jgi:twitching motility protein PilT
MARIDSILRLVKQQGADELHVGVNREPRMFARGTAMRLSIPATSEETLRSLLDELLSSDRERELREHGSLELNYDAGALGVFRVVLDALPAGGFSAVFRNSAGAATEPTEPASGSTTQRDATSRPQPLAAGSTAFPALRTARREQPASLTPAKLNLHAVPAAPEPPPAPTRTQAASPTLAELVAHAAALHASDLHLAEGEPPTLRIAGSLRRLGYDPIEDLSATLALDPTGLARLREGSAIDLACEVPGAGRVRVHAYRSAVGLVAAVRLLPAAAPSFASLNMPLPFDDLVQLPHGLVLVCGPAGSGKSTTLAALAQEALRSRALLLVTLEDPIEYTLSASNQSLIRRRQIGRDVSDFATGLRDALRADPELLLIGELRDPETIALALTAAETGHLVLASMHSGSVASAIERIVDASPTDRQGQVRVQLADSLRAVIAQRLLRRKDSDARVPAVEILRVTRAVASLIREGKTAQFGTVLQSSRREGMLALERNLADRVLAGEIRSEDAFAAANDPEALKQILGR